MPTLPRYEGNPQGAFSGAQKSISQATMPGLAKAETAQKVTGAWAEFMQSKADSMRATESASAITQAVHEYEAWNAGQKPFDEQGKPRFATFAQDAQEKWQEITDQYTAEIGDNVTVQAVNEKLGEYWSRRSIDMLGTANKWEIDYRRGQLNSSLQTAAQTAMLAPADMMAGHVQHVETMIGDAMSAGVISAEEAVKEADNFYTGVQYNRLRMQLMSDPAGALQAVMNPEVQMEPQQRNGLLRETLARIDYMENKETQALNAQRESNALGLAVGVEQGTITTHDLMQMADKRQISRSQFNALMNQTRSTEDGHDDPTMHRELWADIYKGEGSTAAVIQARTNGLINKQTYRAMLNELGSTSGALENERDPKKIFTDPLYRFGVSELERRLKITGPAAALYSEEEGYRISEGLRSFYYDMTEGLLSEGPITMDQVKGAVEHIVSRYKDAVPSGAAGKPMYPDLETAEEMMNTGAMTPREFYREVEAHRLYEDDKPEAPSKKPAAPKSSGGWFGGLFGGEPEKDGMGR